MSKLSSALKQGISEFITDDCMSQAGAVAFYTIFSLPPLLVLVFYLAELAPLPQSSIDRLMRNQLGVPVARNASETTESTTDEVLLQNIAQRTSEQPGSIDQFGPISKLFGVGLLIFTSTGVFAQLQYALNRVWKVEPDPQQGGVKSFIFNRLLSLGMILVIGFLLLVSLVLTTILEELLATIRGTAPDTFTMTVAILLDNVAAFLLASVLFALMFLILPDARMHLRDTLVGAAITSLLFVLGKTAIGWYLEYSQVGSSWGSAAATMIALLVWTYFSSLNVLFGAELTQVWARRYGHGIRPARGAVRTVEEKRHIRSGT